MTLFVIDASHYQDGLPVESLARQGFSAAIFKATEGSSYRDASFPGFLARARAASLPCAAYHFVHPGGYATQAANIAAVVPADVPVWLDCEAGATRDDGYGVADALRSRGGRVAGIYFGAQPKAGYGGWWRAAYLSDPAGTAAYAYARQGGDHGSGWVPGVDLWQFCQHGRISGYSGDVDFSAFRGTRTDLLSHGWFWAPTTTTEDPLNIYVSPDGTRQSGDGIYAVTPNGVHGVSAVEWGVLTTDPSHVLRVIPRAQWAALKTLADLDRKQPVDVAALAAAIVGLLPPGSATAADIAKQTADLIAARLVS